MHIKKWSQFFVILLIILFISACSTNDVTNDVTNNVNENEAENELTSNKGDVVTIKDKTFSEEELAFYKLMNKIKVELQLAQDVDELAGEEAEERITYLKEQIDYYDHYNANLQELIEVYSMSLLAEEKNYFVPDEKLEDNVQEFKELISGIEEIEQRIAEFGEDDFNDHIQEYIRQTNLRDRVVAELEEEIISDNPDKAAQEINFLLGEEYEELYQAHVATLELEIHVQ